MSAHSRCFRFLPNVHSTVTRKHSLHSSIIGRFRKIHLRKLCVYTHAKPFPILLYHTPLLRKFVFGNCALTRRLRKSMGWRGRGRSEGVVFEAFLSAAVLSEGVLWEGVLWEGVLSKPTAAAGCKATVFPTLVCGCVGLFCEFMGLFCCAAPAAAAMLTLLVALRGTLTPTLTLTLTLTALLLTALRSSLHAPCMGGDRLVAVRCSVLQCVAVPLRALVSSPLAPCTEEDAACMPSPPSTPHMEEVALQCVAMCCSALQCACAPAPFSSTCK